MARSEGSVMSRKDDGDTEFPLLIQVAFSPSSLVHEMFLSTNWAQLSFLSNTEQTRHEGWLWLIDLK